MKSGFNDLDKLLTIKKGELIFVGGRPGIGKSTFVQNILSNIAINEKISVAYFNLESSKESIVNKLIKSNPVLKNVKFETYKSIVNKSNLELIEDSDKIINKEATIYIDDTPGISVMEIRSKCRKLRLEKNIGLVVTDYLQLIGFNKNMLLSRNKEIDSIIKSLKILAKELDIPIIVASQLPRSIEKREDKRPMMFDLSGSAILSFADSILFLYRDSYYNKEIKSNSTEIIIARNRNGEFETAKLEWIPELSRFVN